jgi:predicted dehydrogenase
MDAVKWGVMGVAGIFRKKVFVPGRDSDLVVWDAIASRNKEKAAKASAEFGIPKAYGSYEELLDDAEIEAVYIPLPNNLHLEWIKKAADAGKQILCEKPLCRTAAEVTEAIDYCKAKGVLLMEAFMYRFHPQWLHTHDLIRTGAIGDVRAVQSAYFYNNPDPANIRNRTDTAGGALYDIGCYNVSSARYLVGKEPSRALSLINRHPEWGTDVLSSAILDFGDAHATLTAGTLTDRHQHVSVYGSAGRIEIEIPFNTPADTPAIVTVTDGQGTRKVSFEPVDQYGEELELFSLAVRGEEPGSLTPLSDALANQRVLDALFASEASGNWERV